MDHYTHVPAKHFGKGGNGRKPMEGVVLASWYGSVKNQRISVVLRMDAEVSKTLGVEKGDSALVLIGSGPASGTLCVRKNGDRKIRQNSKSPTLFIDVSSVFAKDTPGSYPTPCQYEFKGADLIVTPTPGWQKYIASPHPAPPNYARTANTKPLRVQL